MGRREMQRPFIVLMRLIGWRWKDIRSIKW